MSTAPAAPAASPAAARPLPLPESGVSFSDLGFAAFLALILFAQLDAVANRLSAGLPLSLYSGLYVLAGLCALAAWTGDRGTRLTAVPAPGARFAAAFFLWALVAWTLADNNAAGREYLQGLAKAIGLLVLAMLLVDTPQRLRAAVWAAIAAGLVSALIVYGDSATGSRLVSTSDAAATAQFGGIPRSAGGSDENPTTAAHMLLVSTALLMGLFAGIRAPAMRRACAIGLALCVGALALMAARSAMLGLLVAGAMLLVTLRGDRVFPWLLVGLGCLLAAALLLAPSTLDRIAALGDWARDPTLFRRTTYLAVGFDLFGQSPIWGIGPGNYPLHFVGEEYRYLPGRAPVMRELHNTFLDAAVELGIAGLLLFLAVAASAVAAAKRALGGDERLRAIGLGLLFALAALLVASLFMPNKDMRYLWLIVGLAIQAGRMAARRRRAAP